MKPLNLTHPHLALLTGAIVFFFTSAHCSADVPLIQYQMGQFGPQVQDAINIAAGGDLTKGDGLNTFNVSSTQAYPTAPSLAITFVATTPDLTTAMGNNSYFSFDLTVGANATDLDLTSLTFNAARGGTAGPRGYGVFVTTPTTTDEQVQGATDLTTQRFDWGPLQDIDLTGFTSLQNLTAGQVVNFKILAYAPTTGSSIDFDTITVNGNVTVVPEPTTLSLLGFAALAVLGRRQYFR